jgi:hypothetical protein
MTAPPPGEFARTSISDAPWKQVAPTLQTLAHFDFDWLNTGRE